MNSLPSALKNSRCILHIDLDCFYCQVEQVRLGIPFDTPAAVQQWHGLIAVNYAARKTGIKKMTTVKEAKELCPNIRLLHVATFAENDFEPKYYPNPDRNTHKVSLDAYRTASRNIFKIFHKHCDKIQKIGTDEGFMDVTDTVNQRLIERYINTMPELLDKLDDEVCNVPVDWNKLGFTMESKEEEQKKLLLDVDAPEQTHWSPTTWRDLQLALGAELAAEIRKEVYDKLNYFCSAGIAHYKVTAKLCSNKNKPNGQTILRETARLDFMRNVPFNKIRNLGGKLGTEVGEDLDITVASELWGRPIEYLQKKFGDSTGLYLYNICRGVDNEDVLPSKAPKSLMAAKSFTVPVSHAGDMRRWFTILAAELHRRIIDHYEEYKAWPRSISIRYATLRNRSYRSKGIGAFHRDEMKTPDVLAKKFASVYNSIEDAYPCIGLDLCAAGLMPDESATSRTINSFFTKSTDGNAHHANGLLQETAIEAEKPKPVEQPKPKPKPKPIESPVRKLFFRNNSNEQKKTSPQLPSSTGQDEEMEEETFMCERCNQKVTITQVEEHSDYHFAMDLMNEERQQRHQSRQSQQQPSPSPPARKRKNKMKEELTEDDRKQRKNLFFQPRRNP